MPHLWFHQHLRQLGNGRTPPHRYSCARQLHRIDVARAGAARADSGTKRDCQHPRVKHQHGTRAAYVRDQCRCRERTIANNAAGNQMHRERTFGRWKPYVDATQSGSASTGSPSSAVVTTDTAGASSADGTAHTTPC